MWLLQSASIGNKKDHWHVGRSFGRVWLQACRFPVTGVRSAITSPPSRPSLCFDMCAMVPETWALPTVSRAHPPATSTDCPVVRQGGGGNSPAYRPGADWLLRFPGRALPVALSPGCFATSQACPPFAPLPTIQLWSHRQKVRTHTHTQRPFNGPLSGTTQVSRYQKGKNNLDFTEARDSECQWHQLGCMQVCTSRQTHNLASTPPLSFFYRLDALPAAQPTASKHWRQGTYSGEIESLNRDPRIATLDPEIWFPGD